MPLAFSISIQSDTVARRPALPWTAPASVMARACSASASVNVDLPASGWLMTAKVLRRPASAEIRPGGEVSMVGGAARALSVIAPAMVLAPEGKPVIGRCAATVRRGSRHGEQLLHHDHARHTLQTAFYRDALIDRAFEQLIEGRGDFLHVVDRLVLRGWRCERIPVEGEHRVVGVACRRRGERVLLAVIHLGYQHVLRRFA